MRVRPIFIVALCLAVVGGVLAYALRGGKSRYERLQAAIPAEQKALDAQLAAGRPYLPKTIASIDSLELRRGFRRFTARCQSEYVRCYLVAQPPRAAASDLPGLLRSIGADTDPALPAYRDLASINACRTSRFHAWFVTCTYLALLHGNEIAVLLDPHLRCGSDTAHCRFSGQTQILFTIPAMGPRPSP